MRKRRTLWIVVLVLSVLSPSCFALQSTLDPTTKGAYKKYTTLFENHALPDDETQKRAKALLFELRNNKVPSVSALVYLQLLKIASNNTDKVKFESLLNQLNTLQLTQEERAVVNVLSQLTEVNLLRKMGNSSLAILQAEPLLSAFDNLSSVNNTPFYQGKLSLSISDHAYLYYLLGNSYFLSTDYVKAYEYLMLAMQKYEQTNDLSGQAVINTNLSMISWAQRDFEQAIVYTDKALTIAEQLSDEALLMNNWLNKGVYFQHLKKYDNALAAYQKILSHPNAEHYSLYQIKALLAKADTMQSAGEYILSEQLIKQAINIAEDKNDLVNLNTAKITLANLFTQQQKFDLALPLYLDAEAYFSEINLGRLHSVALASISQMYEQQGRFKEALSYYQQFHILSEKMLKSAQKSTVLGLQEKYLAESKNKQIELLTKQQEVDQIRIKEVEQQRKIVLIVSVATVIILLLLISRYFMRKDAKHLAELNKAIYDNQSQLSLLSHAFKRTSDGVWIVDKDFNIVAVNNAFVQHTHRTKQEAIGHKLTFAPVKGQDKTLAERILLQTKLSGSWQGQLYDLRSNEEVYPLELEVDAITDDDNNLTHYLGIFRDVTEKIRAQEQLSRLATHDDLTGLANRALLEQLIAQSCLTAKHSKKLPTLLLLNVNGFKKINESLGHTIGDQLIIEIGKRLKAILFSKDVIARLSGAEFCVLCELNDPRRSAVRVAQKVMEVFDQAFNIEDHHLNISANMGITIYPQDAKTGEELLRRAAIAMLDVSNSNNIGYRFFEPQMNTSVTKQLEREQKILNAINNHYFDFYFQPILNLSNNDIVGAEALIRWVEPDGTVISPANFIPVAEQGGFIDQIDRIVINRVFAQAAKWQKTGYKFGIISLNLSAKMFLNSEELLTMLSAKLSQYQITATNFKLEITEGMLLDDIQRGIKTMRDLKGLGFQLSLDDFGTGYSSLNYLKKFPIDSLKIDRSFIASMHKNKQDQDIVASIIALAHTLDLTVIAEGVEQEEHIQLLASMDCEYYQGYHYSPPVPAENFEVMLTEKSLQVRRDLT